MKLRSVRSSESASGDAVRPGVSRETARLLPLLAPVTLSAIAALVAAAVSFAMSEPTLGVMGGVVALALAATFVEAYPVPIEGIASGGVSLTAVFIVGAAVIYGWAPAVMIGFIARATIELVQRRPAIRLAYNSAVYALGRRRGRRSGIPHRLRCGDRRTLRRGSLRSGRVLRRQHPAHRRHHLPLVAASPSCRS